MRKSYRITERTVCAGVEVEYKDADKIERSFKRLHGVVLGVTDKSVDLEFASQAELDEFVKIAKAEGAIFERYEER